MKRLIETTDRSLIEALRLAFETEEIDVRVLETGASSLPFTPTIVTVIHDEDWDRAREVLRSLQREPMPYPTRAPRLRRHARVALFVLLSLVAIFCLCFA